jgi:dienelactone hydrolase
MSAPNHALGPLAETFGADLHTLPLDVGGTTHTCLLLVPRRRTSDRHRQPGTGPHNPETSTALLVNIYTDARSALTQPQAAAAPQAFLGAGHAVATMDLPNHGALVDDFGQGLVGMAGALAAGVDVFASLRARGRAAVDACLARGVGRPGRVYTAGASRGGLAALHLLAGDQRVAAAALTCPVTYLPALREFAAQTGAPLAERNSARSLVPQIGGRPIWIAINRDDRRVSTERCREFFAELRAAQGVPSTSVLEMCDGEDHNLPDETYARGGDWLLALATAG